jgi:ribonuclease HII
MNINIIKDKEEKDKEEKGNRKKVCEKKALDRFYNASENDFEICLDEAGRGCLYGRVYIGSVVLPKDPKLFDGTNIKDSKKFTSKKKIQEVANYIKSHALYWNVSYIDSRVIDEINILQSVMRGMHESIHTISQSIIAKETKEGGHYDASNIMLLVDGNYFKPYTYFDTTSETICAFRHETIEQGDATYMGIAAASILAKTARDNYILDICKECPDLVSRYGLDTNMGYGTKKHIDGIREFGLTKDHRKTFRVSKLSEIYDSL